MKKKIEITPNGIKQAIDDLLNENERLKEVIDKIFSRITLLKMEDITMETNKVLNELLDILKEVE